jgi:UDP-glucose 4-epimerase
MLVALTGAHGFLGGHTGEALRRAGHGVRALIRTQRQRSHIRGFVQEWVIGDQTDPQALKRLASGAQAVIHAAMDWKALNQGALPNFKRNALGSLQLLEAARKAGVTQFLFVSTIDVYHHVLPDRPLDETHPTWPNGIYGAFKAAFETHVKTYHFAYGLNTSAWRPATMYGVRSDLERAHWYDLIKQVNGGQSISADNHGNVVHVQDVAEALALAVGDETVSGEFYNLVDTHIAWRDVAEIARELSQSSATIEHRAISGPTPRFDTSKAVAFFNRHGNTAALRRGITGIRDYVGDLLARVER